MAASVVQGSYPQPSLDATSGRQGENDGPTKKPIQRIPQRAAKVQSNYWATASIANDSYRLRPGSAKSVC